MDSRSVLFKMVLTTHAFVGNKRRGILKEGLYNFPQNYSWIKPTCYSHISRLSGLQRQVLRAPTQDNLSTSQSPGDSESKPWVFKPTHFLRQLIGFHLHVESHPHKSQIIMHRPDCIKTTLFNTPLWIAKSWENNVSPSWYRSWSRFVSVQGCACARAWQDGSCRIPAFEAWELVSGAALRLDSRQDRWE